MVGQTLRPLGLLLLSATCAVAYYTSDYPTPYPTREATTEYRTPGWTPDDRYTTPEYITPDDRYTTPDDRYTTPDDRYTTPDDWYTHTTPDDRYTTPDDRYTTPEDRYTTPEPSNGTVPRCPQGWSLYRGNCYVLANSTQWLRADGLCRSMAPGGSLASIHDYSENSFLANLALSDNAYNVWTGLFYDQSVLPGRYKYKWQDGTDLDFSNWMDGYPTHNPHQGCVYMNAYYNFGRWGHGHCMIELNFFCKAPPTREYLDVERDNYGCDYRFEGYGDNCYMFLPDQYLDPHYFNCYDYSESEDLNIKTADENDFVVERMNNLSRHQSPDAFPLRGLVYDAETGFYWNDYYNPDAPYHNFALEDMLNPMAHGEPKTYVDLSTGVWFISDTQARPMGAVCKKPRRR